MTFDLFAAMQAEWLRRPPAHWLIARFLGYESPDDKPQYMDAAAARAWLEASGGRIEGVAPLR